MSARFLLNRRREAGARIESPATRAPLAFHQRLPGYTPTPLIDAPEIAEILGVGQLLLKNESSRLGLPAFKILGASWAVHRALENLAPSARPRTLVTATDGNHGRAVARVAAMFGLGARIYLPRGTAQARIDGIASEGAEVVIVDGTYDEAVERAAREADADCLVVSDTSWPGYEEIPRWVAEGYSTIMWEIDDELARRGWRQPDLIAVQFGVGALAVAVVRHYEGSPAKIVSVEPLRAACALAAIKAGAVVSIPGPHDSIMAGLNCGRVSLVAWPVISRGIAAFIAIGDDRAREAMRALARIGVVAGETGASGVAGLLELLTGPQSAEYRQALEITEQTRVLAFITEGATDPESYESIVQANE
jgi:diaminopropionate ammonia-lyase